MARRRRARSDRQPRLDLYVDIALAVGAAALHLPLREPAAEPQQTSAAQPADGLQPVAGALPLAPAGVASAATRAIAIRAIDPADRDRVQEFVRDLTPESRRRRFFGAIRELSEAMLERLTHPDPRRERVFVAVADAEPRRRIVGIAQFAAIDNGEDCEFALVVADDMQGRGLGRRMMAAVIDAAKASGFRKVVGDVLRENRAMLALARRVGFDIGINAEDPVLMRVVRAIGDRARAVGLRRLANRAPGAAIGA